MSNQDVLDLQHLPEFIAGGGHPFADSSSKKTLAPEEEFNLHALEQRAIQGALRVTDGNRTKAADLLGVSRRTLQRKLRETPHLEK
jgi:transcriptional regulator with PAS, ATPase and Fis domain